MRIRVLCRSANGASEIRAGGDTSEKALKVQSSKFSKSHHNSSLPQLALCSPGAQLLQADLGSTLQLRRLRSGRADRIRGGKPPLQSVWVRTQCCPQPGRQELSKLKRLFDIIT